MKTLILSLLLATCCFAQAAESIEVAGEIQPATQTDVKSRVAARIKKLHVAIGQEVKAGDVLAEIEDKSEGDAPLETKIVAPVAGTILTLSVIERQLVVPAEGTDSGTNLMTIGDLSKLLVEAHIKAADAPKVVANQIAQVRADAIPRESLEARITFIAPVATIHRSVKGFAVQAIIEKPNPKLRPGMTVHLSIPVQPK